MKRTSLSCVIVLCGMPLAWAGPMPQLPELPPLPQNYQTVGSWDDAYAGMVGGIVAGGAAAGTVGVVVGAATVGDTLIFGLEGMGLVQQGSYSIEAGLRLGLPLTDNVAVFTQTSLGTDASQGMFAGLGASLEMQANDALTWRAQYRHAFDLSGDPGKGALMVGILFNF